MSQMAIIMVQSVNYFFREDIRTGGDEVCGRSQFSKVKFEKKSFLHHKSTWRNPQRSKISDITVFCSQRHVD